MVEKLFGQETDEPVIAVLFKGVTPENRLEFGERLFSNPFRNHFESGAFIIRRKDSQSIMRAFDGVDVTDVVEELNTRTKGFRVVRVDARKTGKKLAGKRKKAKMIKDYESGAIYVYNEDGHPVGGYLAENEADAFSQSRLKTLIERPLVFFDSLEEAVASRQAV